MLVISSVFVREEKDFSRCDYILNPNYMFFWSGHSVEYCLLLSKIKNEKMTYLNLRVKDNENKEDCSIKEIRTGSDPSKIVLVVQQSKNRHTIFTWSTRENIQMEAFDVGKEYAIIWDKLGNPYIIDRKRVIFNE